MRQYKKKERQDAYDLHILVGGHSRKAHAYLQEMARRSHWSIKVVGHEILLAFSIYNWLKRPKNDIKQLIEHTTENRNWHYGTPPSYILGWLCRVAKNFAAGILWACYYNYLCKYSRGGIGFWNGTKFQDSILLLAINKLNRQSVFFENGLLPNTTTMDNKGINAANSLPREPAFYLRRPLEDVQLPHFLQPRVGRKKNIPKNQPLPKHYLFVPFQVNRDSQILHHSHWIKNMAYFFYILQSVVHRISDERMQFVIKQHPYCKESYSSLRTLASRDSRIVFRDDDTQNLIENSAAVITVNSTAGVEALLLGKKVIALGDAYYNIRGLVQSVKTKAELITAIDAIDEWQPDEKLRLAFLRYVYRHYCIPDDWRHPSSQHFQAVDERLEKIFSNQI